MATTTRQQLNGLVPTAQAIRDRAARALEHLRDQIDLYDGFGTGTSDGPSSNDVARPVEATMIKVTDLWDSWTSIANKVSYLAELGEKLLVEINDNLPVMPDKSRCSGGMGHPDQDKVHPKLGLWIKPDCDNKPDSRPSRAGLCDACFQSLYRARKASDDAGDGQKWTADQREPAA